MNFWGYTISLPITANLVWRWMVDFEGWDGGSDGLYGRLDLRSAERGAAPEKSAASASKERGCGGNGGGRRHVVMRVG